MQNAIIYRGITKNAFAVQVEGWPGVVEVHCSCIHSDIPRVEFDKLTRSVSAVDRNSLLHVSLSVGEYCLAKRAFVDCELVYPRTLGDKLPEWHPVIQRMVSELAPKPQPPAQKRKRFTTTCSEA